MTALAHLLRNLDPNSSQPLYQQLQRALREAIELRLLGPDDALPSERQLAADLQVSRITVRKAIEGLAEEGLLSRLGSAKSAVWFMSSPSNSSLGSSGDPLSERKIVIFVSPFLRPEEREREKERNPLLQHTSLQPDEQTETTLQPINIFLG